MSETISLGEVQRGQRATIVRVGGVASLRRRFAEMGIVAGESIHVDRIAPLGDPVAYRIKGYRLSLRHEEASQIEVILEGSELHV